MEYFTKSFLYYQKGSKSLRSVRVLAVSIWPQTCPSGHTILKLHWIQPRGYKTFFTLKLSWAWNFKCSLVWKHQEIWHFSGWETPRMLLFLLINVKMPIILRLAELSMNFFIISGPGLLWKKKHWSHSVSTTEAWKFVPKSLLVSSPYELNASTFTTSHQIGRGKIWLVWFRI